MSRIKTWLQDHFQWYRRWKGGKWACWNGFWEQPDESGNLMFLRDPHWGMEGKWYGYSTFIHMGDEYISATEDWSQS